MTNKLKPCPFCGRENLIIIFDDYNNSAVFCNKCGAEGPLKGTEEGAIEAWNRRTEEE